MTISLAKHLAFINPLLIQLVILTVIIKSYYNAFF